MNVSTLVIDEAFYCIYSYLALLCDVEGDFGSTLSPHLLYISFNGTLPVQSIFLGLSNFIQPPAWLVCSFRARPMATILPLYGFQLIKLDCSNFDKESVKLIFEKKNGSFFLSLRLKIHNFFLFHFYFI